MLNMNKLLVIIFTILAINLYSQDIIKIVTVNKSLYIPSQNMDIGQHILSNDAMHTITLSILSDEDPENSLAKLNSLSKSDKYDLLYNYYKKQSDGLIFKKYNLSTDINKGEFDSNTDELVLVGNTFNINSTELYNPFVNYSYIKEIGYDPNHLKRFVVIKHFFNNNELVIGNIKELFVKKDDRVKYNDLIGTLNENTLTIIYKNQNDYINPIILFDKDYKPKILIKTLHNENNLDLKLNKNHIKTSTLINETKNYYLEQLIPIKFEFKDFEIKETFLNEKNEILSIFSTYYSKENQTIKSFINGKVLEINYIPEYGNSLTIIDKSGLMIEFFNLNQVNVKKGQSINLETILGTYSSDEELLIRTSIDGYLVDPALVFSHN